MKANRYYLLLFLFLTWMLPACGVRLTFGPNDSETNNYQEEVQFVPDYDKVNTSWVVRSVGVLCKVIYYFNEREAMNFLEDNGVSVLQVVTIYHSDLYTCWDCGCPSPVYFATRIYNTHLDDAAAVYWRPAEGEEIERIYERLYYRGYPGYVQKSDQHQAIKYSE